MVRYVARARLLLLTLALILVGLTQARAQSLDVRLNGNSVNCPITPTAMPLIPMLPLPAGTPFVGADVFDCHVTFPGEGAFEVFGWMTASNVAVGTTGFNSALAFNATVVPEGPVNPNPGTPVFIDVKQLYDSRNVGAISSNTIVDGRCSSNLTNSGSGITALSFTVNTSQTLINNPPPPVNPFFPCGVTGSITALNPGGGNSQPGGLILEQVGTVFFPPSSARPGAAVTLQMQQVAFPVGIGGGPFPLAPPAFPSVSLSAHGMNEFVPPPDPSNGFVMVFVGDVRDDIDIDHMQSDPTLNPFAYVDPRFLSRASLDLDGNGNTVLTFSGEVAISNELFCYGGPCNNLPHFGVAASRRACNGFGICTTLKMLAQYWTNEPANVLPGLTVAGPPLTGSPVASTIVFAEVTTGSNTVGHWFQVPSPTRAAPQLTFCNYTAAGVTTSHVGFHLSPVAILQTLNFGTEPPPGLPGSTFIDLGPLNGRFLASGECVTFNPEPDIAVGTGNPIRQGTKLTVAVNLNNTGATSAANVTISSVKPTLPATYVGPALPLIVGNIGAGTSGSQNIQIDVTGLASGSIARFQINGSFQDTAGNNFQYSAVRGVKVP